MVKCQERSRKPFSPLWGSCHARAGLFNWQEWSRKQVSPLKRFSEARAGLFRYQHCKNKLVVLTTEWLPWLQTSWRDSGYERFALIWKSNCIRQHKMQQPSSSYNHNTLTTFRTSVNESQQMHFKVVATTFHALNASR